MNIWIRKNGIGHAFSREIGCKCKRCTTVKYNLTPPPTVLEPFEGWNDPPWRAHTSASLFFGENGGDIEDHILIDCGAGVVDSLMSSGLKGIEKLSALLITHWHPDHILSINQLCESLKRNVTGFNKLPLYCTLDTYDRLRQEQGFNFECKRFLKFQELIPEQSFNVPLGSMKVVFSPLPVAHGSTKGAIVFVAEIQTKKIVFLWDIDVPSAKIPTNTSVTNRDIVQKHLKISKIDCLFMASNTWEATGTGHTSYQLAQDYIKIINSNEVYLTHISGHEDRLGNKGYGWPDEVWEKEVNKNGHRVAKQGMIIQL